MDHLNLNPTGTTGIVNSGQATPPPNTPAPYNATFTGAIDGSDPATASKNMAWIYNMLSSEVRNVLLAAGVTPDKDNWAQLAQSITAIAQSAAAGVTPPNAFQSASEAAMLAANAKDNDICVRTDLGNQWFVCLALPSTDINNWAALPVQQSIQFATNAEVAAGTIANKAIAPDTADANFLSKVDTAAQTVQGDIEFAGNALPKWGNNLNNIVYVGLAFDPAGLSRSGAYYGEFVGVTGSPIFGFCEHVRISTDTASQVITDIFTAQKYARVQNNNTWSAWQSLGGAPTRTRQDVTASRALGAIYTNTTGRDKWINVRVIGGGNTGIDTFINGIKVATDYSVGTVGVTASCLVFAGETYSFPAAVGGVAPALQRWEETDL